MTLNIKTGDWAVLREGTIEGPMIVKEDTKHTMYPVETGSCCTRSWTIDGKYYHPSETIGVEDDALDIITTLPCPPLERIRQLETEMEKAKGELQTLSSYLGAGMGNDDDPVSRFVERIKFGVDEFSNGLERIAEDRANRIRQLEEALRFYAENSTLWSAMDKDDGKTARRALGESK